MTDAEADWTRLGKLIVERRSELGLTQADVQAAGGPSVATLRIIEGARNTSYRHSVLRDLEIALLWQPGSVDAILRGGDPTDARTTSESDLVKLLTEVQAVADNPRASPAMRRLARTQLDLIQRQLDAIIEAARDDQRREQTG